MNLCLLTFVSAMTALLSIASAQRRSRGWNLERGQPGMKIRLTRKGLNYLRQVGMQTLNQEVPKIRGVTAQAAFGGGSVVLKNVRVTSYTPPRLSVINLSPPKSIVLGLEGMTVGIDGEFLGTSGPWTVPGDVSGEAKGITLAITIDLKRVNQGQLQATVSSCKVVVKDTNIEVFPTGPLASFVEPYKPAINNGIKTGLPTMLCNSLRSVVQSTLAGYLSRLTHIDLDALGGRRIPGVSADTADLIKILSKDLIIANRLTSAPVMTRDYIDIPLAGELRYTSSLPAPFYPNPMPPIKGTSKMLYVVGSDYMINSLLFHAYNQDKIKLLLTQDVLPGEYKAVLQTSCAAKPPPRRRVPGKRRFSSLCIGSLIPSIGEQFPNQTMKLLIVPFGLPEFKFEGKKGKISGISRVLVYANNRQIMVTDATGQADISLRISDEQRITGRVKINKLHLAVWRSAIKNLDPADVRQLGPLSKNIITPQLAAGLRQGMPIPTGGLPVEFENADLQLSDGIATFSTDLLAQGEAIRSLVSSAVNQGLRSAGK